MFRWRCGSLRFQPLWQPDVRHGLNIARCWTSTFGKPKTQNNKTVWTTEVNKGSHCEFFHFKWSTWALFAALEHVDHLAVTEFDFQPHLIQKCGVGGYLFSAISHSVMLVCVRKRCWLLGKSWKYKRFYPASSPTCNVWVCCALSLKTLKAFQTIFWTSSTSCFLFPKFELATALPEFHAAWLFGFHPAFSCTVWCWHVLLNRKGDHCEFLHFKWSTWVLFAALGHVHRLAVEEFDFQPRLIQKCGVSGYLFSTIKVLCRHASHSVMRVQSVCVCVCVFVPLASRFSRSQAFKPIFWTSSICFWFPKAHSQAKGGLMLHFLEFLGAGPLRAPVKERETET